MAKKKELTERDKIQNMQKQQKEYVDKLVKEPKVGILGNKMFIKFFGPQHTYDLNGFPVKIVFNGKVQYYPESVARNLAEVLDKMADSTIPVNLIEEIN